MNINLKNNFYAIFLNIITVFVSIVVVLPKMNFDCVSLINKYSMGLSNPRTQAMFGILELYDYIMLFLLLILIIKMVFFFNALYTSTQYISAFESKWDEKEFNRYNNYYINKFKNTNKSNSDTINKKQPDGIDDILYASDEFKRDYWASIKFKYLQFWYETYVKRRIYTWKHSPVIEYIWTIFPAVVLGLMGVPSFLLLYSLEESSEPVFNISVIGNQWYWTYEYLDFDIHKFFSILVSERCESSIDIFKSFIKNFYVSTDEQEELNSIADNSIILDELNDGGVEEECIDFNDVDNFAATSLFFANYYHISLLDDDELLRFPNFILSSSQNENIDDFYLYSFNDFVDFVKMYDKIEGGCIIDTDVINNKANYIFGELINLVDLCHTGEFDFTYDIFDAVKPVLYYQLGDSFSKVIQSIENTISIDSQILPDSDLPLGYPRLLSTDQVLVIPTDTTIRFLITSNDVIHSWALPSFGIKIDAVPGRINQVITKTPFCGSSWGQCSELCGVNHGFMPIEIRAMALNDFNFYIKLIIRSLIEPGLDKLFLNSYVGVLFYMS